jgi:hypothetical protein
MTDFFKITGLRGFLKRSSGYDDMKTRRRTGFINTLKTKRAADEIISAHTGKTNR